VIVVGVDPGATGAVGVLRDGRFIKVYDLPMYKRLMGGKRAQARADRIKAKPKGQKTAADKKKPKTRREYDRPALAEIFWRIKEKSDELNEEVFLLIEEVGVQPRDGKVGAFQFGKGFGILLGIAAAVGFDAKLVRPGEWKKRMFGMAGSSKAESIASAKALFPDAADQLTRVKDDGRAEAILLAEYARRFEGAL